MGNDLAGALVERLEGVGLTAFFGGIAGSPAKAYSNVIASRGRLRGVAPGWAKAPWPQLLTRATVTIDSREIDVVSAHMPIGSGNGWRKIDTFDALADVLASAPTMPRILGGDFNEPGSSSRPGTLSASGPSDV